jgi:hypothetical protein
MAQIEATAGQPYELHYGHGCGYTAAKFERGQLNCSIYYAFTYEATSQAASNKLALELAPIIATDANQISSSPRTLSEVNGSLHYDFDLKDSSLRCSYGFQAIDKRFYNSVLHGNNLKSVSAAYAATFSYNCGKPVVKALYPVEKTP